MAAMTTVEAREHFSELVNRSAFGKERILLTRRGKDLVAVVPMEDYKLLEELEDQIDLRAAMLALKEAEEKGTASWEEIKKENGL